MSLKCLNLGGMIVEHQERARESQHDEEVERDATHPPGIVVSHCIPVDLGWMQVKEDIA